MDDSVNNSGRNSASSTDDIEARGAAAHPGPRGAADHPGPRQEGSQSPVLPLTGDGSTPEL